MSIRPRMARWWWPWYGVVTRAGTPKPVVAKLNRDIVGILKTADMHERITKAGAEPSAMTTAELAAFLKSESAKWGELVRDSGRKAD